MQSVPCLVGWEHPIPMSPWTHADLEAVLRRLLEILRAGLCGRPCLELPGACPFGVVPAAGGVQ
jgi:hypothetical protein